MKKWLSLILSVLFILALAACGEKTPENELVTVPETETPALPEDGERRVAFEAESYVQDVSFDETETVSSRIFRSEQELTAFF